MAKDHSGLPKALAAMDSHGSSHGIQSSPHRTSCCSCFGFGLHRIFTAWRTGRIDSAAEHTTTTLKPGLPTVVCASAPIRKRRRSRKDRVMGRSSDVGLLRAADASSGSVESAIGLSTSPTVAISNRKPTKCIQAGSYASRNEC
eukprot:8078800-Karenia_brevis.AAC.1